MGSSPLQNMDIQLYVFMPIIFFIYGMSFFVLGATILIENLSTNTSSRRLENIFLSATGALAFFGILHGIYAFLGMIPILYSPGFTLRLGRFVILSIAFYSLFKFGVRLKQKEDVLRSQSDLKSEISSKTRHKKGIASYAPALLLILFLISIAYILITNRSERPLREAEIFLRYFMGFPASLLAAYSLSRAGRVFGPGSGKFRLVAAIGFLLYAITVIITPRADFFPASLLNYSKFNSLMHMPVQIFRSAFAIVITLSLFMLFKTSKEFHSIRFKAIVHILTTVAIPAIIVVAIGCYLITGSLLKTSIGENQRIAELLSEKAESFFDDAVAKVNNYLLFYSLASPDHLSEVFVSLVRDNFWINGIVFMDSKGKEMLRVEQDASFAEVRSETGQNKGRIRNLSNSFTNPISDGPPNYIINGHDGRRADIEIPMEGGKIVIFLSLQRIYDSIFSTAMPMEKWDMMLMDGDGYIAAPALAAETGKSGHNFRYPRELRDTTVVEHGEVYSVFMSAIGSTGWAVAIKISRSYIAAPIFHIYKVFVFGSLAVYICALAFGLFFMESLTRPLRLMMRRVEEIGREESGSKLVLNSADEFKFLAEEIEKTAGILQEKRELEKKVAKNERIASVGRLAAGIAHEINNPLGIIYGYSQMLLREHDQESDISGDLRIIEKHAARCKKIVSGLLMFARESRNEQSLVDIRKSIEDVIALSEAELNGRKITVSFSPGSRPRLISIDPDRLHQLLSNLVSNASDAMEITGGRLDISVGLLKEDCKDFCEITFSDTGSGISQKDLDKIFDPFYTTKKVGKGTGLGLFICYSIVNEYKGRIWAESAPEKGTTFHVVFPLVKEVPASDKETEKTFAAASDKLQTGLIAGPGEDIQ